MSETDNTVNETLAQWGIGFSARYAGECKKWEGQQVDHFRVTIGTFETDFYQGLGHRKSTAERKCPYPVNTMGAEAWRKQYVRPVAPTAAAVLYCLLSDASATDQCFADWASDFGMDIDSRKALATYEACCATGLALRKVFTRAQRAKLSDLLQDY